MKTRKEWYEDLCDYRETYGLKEIKGGLSVFLNWADANYADDPYLTQEMINTWGEKRDTESNRSHAARVRPVNYFIKFINQRSDGLKLICISHGKYEPVRDPILFTKEQLSNFFRAVDELPLVNEKDLVKSPDSRVRRCTFLTALECPVFFRLMYCTGMRSCEMRFLECMDVNLQNGTIIIRKTKGYSEHMVAVDKDTRLMLIEYDKLMSKLMPHRKVFFPDFEDKYHCEWWLKTNFRKCWDKYNPPPKNGELPAVPYSFRHNYAIQNVNSWQGDMSENDMKMTVLSKSMGHSSTIFTEYYYHLIPRFAGIVEDLFHNKLDDLLPDVED